MAQQRFRLMVCVVAFLGLLATGAVHAQDDSVVALIQAEPGVEGLEVQQPEFNSCLQEEEVWTLEQIEEAVGRKNVCGIMCGRFTGVDCTFECGDAATCWNEYCVYL